MVGQYLARLSAAVPGRHIALAGTGGHPLLREPRVLFSEPRNRASLFTGPGFALGVVLCPGGCRAVIGDWTRLGKEIAYRTT